MDAALSTHTHARAHTHPHRPYLPHDASSCHLCTNELKSLSFPVPYVFPRQTLPSSRAPLYNTLRHMAVLYLHRVCRRTHRLGAKKKTPKEMVRRRKMCVLRIAERAERALQQKRQEGTSRVARCRVRHTHTHTHTHTPTLTLHTSRRHHRSRFSA